MSTVHLISSSWKAWSLPSSLQPCVSATSCGAPLQGAWQVGKSVAAYERILCRSWALQTLITKYATLLFLMRRNVRQCHWRLHFAHTGFHVNFFFANAMAPLSGGAFGASGLTPYGSACFRSAVYKVHRQLWKGPIQWLDLSFVHNDCCK